jgi:predicted dithiol-disulfide oxidoreductase (DUF899 family)
MIIGTREQFDTARRALLERDRAPLGRDEAGGSRTRRHDHYEGAIA